MSMAAWLATSLQLLDAGVRGNKADNRLLLLVQCISQLGRVFFRCGVLEKST